jgi:hypothetical protein
MHTIIIGRFLCELRLLTIKLQSEQYWFIFSALFTAIIQCQERNLALSVATSKQRVFFRLSSGGDPLVMKVKYVQPGLDSFQKMCFIVFFSH